MNERFTLNSVELRKWLESGGRKQSFLARQLGVSDSLVDLMLGGHVPKERTLKALVNLTGISMEVLLIPKSEAKRAG
jgi:transcriptional regulator with XRE-family HTH domain